MFVCLYVAMLTPSVRESAPHFLEMLLTELHGITSRPTSRSNTIVRLKQMAFVATYKSPFFPRYVHEKNALTSPIAGPNGFGCCTIELRGSRSGDAILLSSSAFFGENIDRNDIGTGALDSLDRLHINLFNMSLVGGHQLYFWVLVNLLRLYCS